jgi:hypothetical protein
MVVKKTSVTPSGWAQTNCTFANQCTTQCATQCSTRCANHGDELEEEDAKNDDEIGLVLFLASSHTNEQEMEFKSLTNLEGDSPPIPSDLPDLPPLSVPKEDRETATFLGGKYFGTAQQASPGQDKIFEAFVSGLEKITPTPSLQLSSRVPQKDDRG